MASDRPASFSDATRRASLGSGLAVIAPATAERLPWLTWIDRISAVAAAIGGLATVGMMLHLVADVTCRAFFNYPLPGTLEITQNAWMPTLVALGLGYALVRGEHIRVNLLTAPTGLRAQRIVEVVSMIFMLATIGMLSWFGVERAYGSFGETGYVSLWFPIWPFRWVVALGLIVLLLQSFATLMRAITVEEFVPSDADEALAELEAEGIVLEDLGVADETSAVEKVDLR